MGLSVAAPTARARDFFALYTRGLTGDDFHRLFTRDARDAYRYFARGIDVAALDDLPLHRRVLARVRLFFIAFSLKLSPARRALFGIGIAAAIIGLIQLFDGFEVMSLPLAGPFFRVALPTPVWVDGSLWLLVGFLCTQRLAPRGRRPAIAQERPERGSQDPARHAAAGHVPGTGCCRARPHPPRQHGRERLLRHPGVTRWAARRGRRRRGGKGKSSGPAHGAAAGRLPYLDRRGIGSGQAGRAAQGHVARHAPGSRFITFFYAAYDPRSGKLRYVNAGHPPALIRRQSGTYHRLRRGGMALGMFDGSTYETGSTELAPGDTLVAFSDGITEAEDPSGQPFDEAGIAAALDGHPDAEPEHVGDLLFSAVASHTQEDRFADDLTSLALRRLPTTE